VLYPAWTSVESFFVLSGFLIGGILMDTVRTTNFYSTFYVRRVFRILPLYLVCLVVFALASGSGLFDDDPALVRYVEPGIPAVHLLTFTQNLWWAVHPGLTPFWVAPTWTLAIEEQFYLILPFMLREIPPRRQPLVFLTCICTAPVFRFFMFKQLGPTAPYVLFPGQMDTLFIGVLGAWIVRDPTWSLRLKQHRKLLIGALVILSVGLAWFSYALWLPARFEMAVFGVVWLALFYMVGVYLAATEPGAEALARRYGRVFSWIGTRAFSIYLFHVGLIATLEWAAPQSSVNQRALLLALILIPIAWASWKWIERPFITYSRQRFRYQAAAVVVPAEPSRQALETAG
jgi:peptidoglycan/LPS O-acetylase OafA/YrhL